MKHFAVYDIAAGVIRRRGSCMAADFALQAGEGETVIEIDGASGDSSVVDMTRAPSLPPAKPDPRARR